MTCGVHAEMSKEHITGAAQRGAGRPLGAHGWGRAVLLLGLSACSHYKQKEKLVLAMLL